MLEIDNMEYATDAEAQAAYITSYPIGLQCYSEPTIKTEGNYSLKAVAYNNNYFIKRFSPSMDFSKVKNLKLDMRANRTGQNVKLGLYSGGMASGGTITDNGIDTATGLILHYKMNDNAANLLVSDSSPMGNNGTCTQDTANISVGGVINEALDFQSGDFITLNEPIVFGEDATISCWVKDYTVGSCLAGNSSQGVARYLYHYTDGNLYLGSNTFPEQVNWPTYPLNLSGWHCFQITKQDNVVEFIFDGVSQGTRILSTIADIETIAKGFTDLLYVKVDDFRIYNRKLNEFELLALYNDSMGTEDVETTAATHIIHTFENSGNFSTPSNLTDVSVLIVAGGGAGGAGESNPGCGGGGGAGGVIDPSTSNVVPTMTGYTSPSGEVSASNEVGAPYLAWKAFQNQYPTDSDGWAAIWTMSPEWLQYKFDTAKIISKYVLISRNETSNSRVPKSWTLQASNTGLFSGEEVSLHSQTDVVDWASQGSIGKSFSFANTNAYLYYRLVITDSNDMSYVGVGTLQLFEKVELSIPIGTYPVVVGNGGNAEGVSGQDSSFNGNTAIGGGQGGAYPGTGGGTGGSGGGAAQAGGTGYAGTPGQGNKGGNVLGYGGAGGGGAGAVGNDDWNVWGSYENGGDGGVGIQSDITYIPKYYGGGGGGFTHTSGDTRSVGGLGGGGAGGFNSVGADGVNGFGGGGGAGGEFHSGGKGGNGVVIIRYAVPEYTVVSEITPNIAVADQFQTLNWDISAIADSSKNAISSFKIEMVNADNENTFYLDNFEIAQAIDVVGMVD